MRVFFDAAQMQAKGISSGELKRIIKDRFKSGYYKAPERGGISYMLSPILRTYFNPEESDNVVTLISTMQVVSAGGTPKNSPDDGGRPLSRL